jgi:hypothetical protein
MFKRIEKCQDQYRATPGKDHCRFHGVLISGWWLLSRIDSPPAQPSRSMLE